MWFRSLGQEDPLEEEEGMATTPLFLPGESRGQRTLACYNHEACYNHYNLC